MPADLNGQFTVSQLAAKRVAVSAGTQTFAGVDIKNYIENCIIAVTHNEISASGNTSIQYSVLDSADNITFAASAGLPTFAANTAASATLQVALDTRNCKRYVQLKALTASTTATFDIGAVFIGLQQVS